MFISLSHLCVFHYLTYVEHITFLYTLGSVLAPQYVSERPGMCGSLMLPEGPHLSTTTLTVHSKEGDWCDTVRDVLSCM